MTTACSRRARADLPGKKLLDVYFSIPIVLYV
jgi:hypothetical protein